MRYGQLTVDGHSMMPYLHDGDLLLADRSRKVLKQVTHRDVVAFKQYADKKRYNKNGFIKRIIGMPGDTIQFENGKCYVNGALDMTKTNGKTSGINVVVPEGMCFVMGDNRAESQDSRQCGFVRLKDIWGVAIEFMRPKKSKQHAKKKIATISETYKTIRDDVYRKWGLE